MWPWCSNWMSWNDETQKLYSSTTAYFCRKHNWIHNQVTVCWHTCGAWVAAKADDSSIQVSSEPLSAPYTGQPTPTRLYLSWCAPTILLQQEINFSVHCCPVIVTGCLVWLALCPSRGPSWCDTELQPALLCPESLRAQPVPLLPRWQTSWPAALSWQPDVHPTPLPDLVCSAGQQAQ